MRNALHRVRDRVLSADSRIVDGALGAGYTVLASVAERRRCRVRKSDGVWLHEWDGGAYLCASPVRRPVNEAEHLYPYFLFRYTPKPGDVVVDVGAGVGTEALVFSRLVGPAGRVVSIEAHPPSAALLERTVQHLRLSNVTVIGAAVAAHEGPVTISDGDAAIANRLTDSGITVRGATLPVLLAEVGVTEVDYMKVNIEGAERLLLEGLEGSSLVIREICVSCHDFLDGDWYQTFESSRAWLTEHGYEVSSHPSVDGAPYSQYYLYGSRQASADSTSS